MRSSDGDVGTAFGSDGANATGAATKPDTKPSVEDAVGQFATGTTRDETSGTASGTTS